MQDDQDIAVKVDNVTKDFTLHHEKTSSIKSSIVNIFKPKESTNENYQVLKGVSLDIKKGEFFGIVGRNGSGKSTLLKIIAEIYSPTTGSVDVKGKLVPFIELGVGFNPELTGRENVYLNGALLGFSRKEMEEKYDAIVEFAELEQFMDQKLKNYSSGMQVRLAFSVAIRADADIMLIDEVLAVGDEAFQRKCLAYFAKLKKDKKTVIFVTHSMEAVQQFCDRAVLIDKGHKMEIGTPLDISQLYSKLNDNATEISASKNREIQTTTRFVKGISRAEVKPDSVDLTLEVTPIEELDDPIVAIEIFKDDGAQVYRWVSEENLDYPLSMKKGEQTTINLGLQNIFPVGEFSVRLLILKRDRSERYGVFDDSAVFNIINDTPYKHNIHWKPTEQVSVNYLEVS